MIIVQTNSQFVNEISLKKLSANLKAGRLDSFGSPAYIMGVNNREVPVTIIRTAESFGQFRIIGSTFSFDSDKANNEGWLTSFAKWEDEYIYSNWDLRDIIDRFYMDCLDRFDMACLDSIAFSGDYINIGIVKGISDKVDCFMSEGDDYISISIKKPAWITDSSWNRVHSLLLR
jgi:hypothetical protein